MLERDLTVVNDQGFHLRPAQVFVTAAQKFKSSVRIKSMANGKEADAKSLIAIMTLGLAKGSQFTLTTEGEDEAIALGELCDLVNKGFSE